MPMLTYLEAISDALREEMRRDPTVFLLGEDIGIYGGAFKVTKGFLAEFGQRRVLDTPISEAAIIGAAIGAALNGLRPVAEMQYMDFVTNGFNQLVNVAATIAYRWGLPVPIVVRGPAGGGVGGGPFHSRNPEAWFAHTPGLKVVYPAFPADAKGLLIAAIRDPNPVIFLEHKALYRKVRQAVPEGAYALSLGQAHVVRPGQHLSII
ncbi:MAG: alpha-ketoacid dehydrogenase subunit beta, partial [Bacteroidota bacterium]|nr:alpha-ketoacid dehydrogenase subunit beta [Bacteroidota bacterium]